MENPWKVDSVEAFAYLKCPECIFDAKEETIFQNHAVENHPLSHVLFGKSVNVDGIKILIQKYDPLEKENGNTEDFANFQFSSINSLEDPKIMKEELPEIPDQEKHLFVDTNNQIFEVIEEFDFVEGETYDFIGDTKLDFSLDQGLNPHIEKHSEVNMGKE